MLLAGIRTRTNADQQQRFIDAYLQTIQPYSHWSHRDLSDYVPKLYARADQHRRHLLVSADRRCLLNSKYCRRIKLTQGWSARVFLQTKHPRQDCPASQCRFSTDDWQNALADPASLPCAEEILKKGGRTTVTARNLRIGPTELQVVVKHSPLRTGLRGFLEYLRPSRAVKQWHIAHALTNRRLPTAWPLAALEHHRFGLLTESILITEHIDHASNLRVMIRDNRLPPPGRERTKLARSLGRLIAQLQLEDLRHRDCKLSNIMVREPSPECPAYQPYLIDLDGLAIRRQPFILRPHEALIRAAASIPPRHMPPLRDLLTAFGAYVEALDLPEAHNPLQRKRLWLIIAAAAARFSAKSRQKTAQGSDTPRTKRVSPDRT